MRRRRRVVEKKQILCEIQTQKGGWECLIQHLESIHQFLIDGNYCSGRSGRITCIICSHADKARPYFTSCFLSHTQKCFCVRRLWLSWRLFFSFWENILPLSWRDSVDGRRFCQQTFCHFYLICRVKCDTWWLSTFVRQFRAAKSHLKS